MKANEVFPGIEQKERPPELFIAARTPDMQEILPMKGRSRLKDEGAVIFATPDKALASAFLVEGHGDHWMKIGYYRDILVVVIKAEREQFIEQDHGGSMYTVPSGTFDFDPKKGMGEKEWTSRVPVKPLSEMRYSSALDTMIDNGVQVYFVDSATFEAIKNANDHGLGILTKLTSENQKCNTNIRLLSELDEGAT